MSLIEIKNLHASVDGKAILKGVDLTIKAGEVHAIMGPNAGMWQNLITFVVVLLLILIFPNGILGKKYIKKV